MKLRSDDPTSMKDFVLGIQHRVNEIKTSPSGTQDENSKINSKRVSWLCFCLFLANRVKLDISYFFPTVYVDRVYAWYNMWNKKQKKRTKEDPAHHTRLKKWLQKVNYNLLVFWEPWFFYYWRWLALRVHILCSMWWTILLFVHVMC